MRAVVVRGPGDLDCVDVPDPEPLDYEAVVAVRAAGICGSDLPRVFGGSARHYPIILGHEFAGDVVGVGSRVTRVRPGDRVAVAPLVPCFRCDRCRTGAYSMCPDYVLIGTRKSGGFAELVTVPEKNLVAIPAHLTYVEAALIEPATVSVAALMEEGDLAGKSVAVVGSGAIGLFAAQWAKVLGSRRVLILDVLESRLKVAAALGLEGRQVADPGGDAEARFDIVVEAAGTGAATVAAIRMAAHRGHVVCLGIPSGDVNIPVEVFDRVVRKGLRIQGSWMSYSPPFPGREWPLVVEAFASKRLKAREIVSHTFPLSRCREAFDVAGRGAGPCSKVLFVND